MLFIWQHLSEEPKLSNLCNSGVQFFQHYRDCSSKPFIGEVGERWQRKENLETCSMPSSIRLSSQTSKRRINQMPVLIK